MMDVFCNSLSDEAQLKIALRLGNAAVQSWSKHFKEFPEDIDKVNALVSEANRVKGGAKIDIDFPKRSLEKIERSYLAAKEKSPTSPIPIMKRDATLSPLLASCMQPLTNKHWDNTFPEAVRLVFTGVFNILVWLLHRRKNAAGETHIYVAINQAADVLLRGASQDINAILEQYKHEVRGETEDRDWENALRVGSSEPLDQEDIYRRIIGEHVSKGQCGQTLAKEVLRQMREEGKTYWDELEEYQSGTSKTYSFNKEEACFWLNEVDVIVGSFNNDYSMTENEMLEFIASRTLADLRDNGFEV